MASGEIGRLEQLVITSRDPAPAPAAYIATSGGLFRDMTIHDFDMARFFLGDIVEVQAMGANLIEPYIAEAGDIDSAMVVLRGAGGELCQIVNSRRCSFGYDQRLEAFGAEAMLSAGNQTATSVRWSGASGTETAPPYLNFFLDRYAAAYRAELDHLISCAERARPRAPASPTDARRWSWPMPRTRACRPAAPSGSTSPQGKQHTRAVTVPAGSHRWPLADRYGWYGRTKQAVSPSKQAWVPAGASSNGRLPAAISISPPKQTAWSGLDSSTRFRNRWPAGPTRPGPGWSQPRSTEKTP